MIVLEPIIFNGSWGMYVYPLWYQILFPWGFLCLVIVLTLIVETLAVRWLVRGDELNKDSSKKFWFLCIGLINGLTAGLGIIVFILMAMSQTAWS